jgi:hypothetical protein
MRFPSTRVGAFALLAVLSLPVANAKAASITLTYDFTVSGLGSVSPVDPWHGTFTITYDPTATGNSLGTLDSFTSNLPASYSPFVFAQYTSHLIIGDNCSPGTCSALTQTDQAWFWFAIDSNGSPTNFIQASISNASFTNVPVTNNFTVTLSPTPLPPALPLFASGLGALGLLGWRRKKKTQAVAA